MSETTNNFEQPEALNQVKGLWQRYNKMIIYAGSGLILLLAGWIGYDKLVREPKELKAEETVFLAEDLFGKMASTGFNKDSVNLVLNGGNLDGANMTGLLKVMSNYGGTKTANRAAYMAGACYLHIKEFDKAIKYLKDFNGYGAKQVESKAYILLGHAYAEKNQVDEAMSSYKKATTSNPEDESMTPDALMLYAGYAEANNKNTEAISAYKQIKEQFPNYLASANGEVDKRLARLGELN
jgi:TolA-binding protein